MMFWIIKKLDVLYIPQTEINLFSPGKTLDKGLSLISEAEKPQFVNKDYIITAIATRSNKLFKIA